MKHLLLLAAIAAVPAFAAERVELQPGKSIAQTIISVRPGDTISLAPGIYKESIVIKDRVTLLGSDPSSTTIKGNGRETTVKLNGSAAIHGITVTKGKNGIQTQSGTAKITNCVITGNQGSGILAIKKMPEIINTVISHNAGNGIQGSEIDGGSLIIENITVASNNGFGIDISGTVPVSISNSIFYRNSLRALNDRDKQIVATNNVFYPAEKEYTQNNRSVKPLFLKEKKLRPLYIQSSSSPVKDAGAQIKR